MGDDPGLIAMIPVHFVLLGSAGPEKGEPSLRMLSDRFRSVTATSHMKDAFFLVSTVRIACKNLVKLHRTELNGPDGNPS